MVKEKTLTQRICDLRPQILKFAKTLTSDEDAEDLVQDTLMKAIQHQDQHNQNFSLKAWVTRICLNLFLDGKREANKMKKDEITGEIGTVENTVDFNFLLEHAEQALAKLPEAMQEIMKLRMEGTDFNEISEKLGVSHTALWTKIFYARQKLRKQFQSYEVRQKRKKKGK